MANRSYPHKFETSVQVQATPEQLFAELDDQERLSAHMMQSSAMMAGNRMHFDFDAARGREVGSKMRLSGDMLGFHLEVEEVVTERSPPQRKAWETIGEPHLLVIGNYRMGFIIEATDSGSQLNVFIEYDEPPQPWTMLARLLGPVYARWCTVSMAEGAAKRFQSGAKTNVPGTSEQI